MTRLSQFPACDTPPHLTALVEAARCWRRACDAGEPVQPRLSKALEAHECTMLAPVLDSLCRFYENALERPMMVGDVAALSGDERLLLGLVERGGTRACLGCPERAASALDCALCSTQIMMALAFGQSGRTRQ